MSRMIDADALIEDLKKWKGLNGNTIEAVIDTINNQPTAYDVENVVAELEEAKDQISLYGDDLDCYCEGLNTAIGIVRKTNY